MSLSPAQNASLMSGTFHTTRWTQVLAARDLTGPGSEALSQLCAAYYAPVTAFLRREGRTDDAARELAHEFFAQVLEGKAFARADPAFGRFRSYLLGAVKHFLVRKREYDERFCRGGGAVLVPMDAPTEADASGLSIEDHTQLSPDAAFDREWALTVLARALDSLRAECVAEGKEKLFDHLKPWLTGESTHGDQSALSDVLGMNGVAVRRAVFRLRQRFRQNVKSEIAMTLDDPSMVAEEMQALFSSLSG